MKASFMKALKCSKANFQKVLSAARKAATKDKDERRSRCALLSAAVIEKLENRMQGTYRTMQAGEDDDALFVEQLRTTNQVLKSQLVAECVCRSGCKWCSLKVAQAASQNA